MELVSNSPLRVASIIWQPRAGSFSLTVVAKATFLLLPGESQLAPTQEVLTKADEAWSGDPTRSLWAASDIAPLKPRADVLLVGHAFAPGQVPMRSLRVRLNVGEVDKTIEISCARSIAPDGSMQEGTPFTTVPLAYELAAGGPETTNPVGVRNQRDAYGRTALPSMHAPGTPPGGPYEPIGFGPISPAWPERAVRLGPHAGSWNPVKWYRQPIPEGLELAYFNAAPHDQQPLSLSEDESIVLENLNPEHPLLVTRLPGLRLRSLVELPGRAPQDLALRADTLWINTDRAICTLVYRGSFPVDHPLQEGRVTITTDMASSRGHHEETVIAARAPATSDEALPFAHAPPSVPHPHSTGGLPFSGSAPLPPPPPVSSRRQETTAMPVFPPPPVSMRSPDAPPTEPPPPPVDEAPPPKTEPPPPPIVQVQHPPSIPPPASMPRTIGEVMAMRASNPEISQPIASGPRQPEMLGTPIAPPAADPAEGAGFSGALAASNAAAGSEARPNWTPPRAAPVRALPDDIDGTLLELVWFDRDTVSWMRRVSAWKPILAELDKRPPDPAFDDPVLARDPAEVEDRREVFEILLQSAATDAEGLRVAMNEGMRPDGKFISTLLTLSGEIELPFDEVESLKAMIPTAAWFMGQPTGQPDPLSSAIEAALKFLGTPGHPSASVAEGYADNIKKAFKQQKHGGLEYLEGPTERTLLERRAYQRRPVLGGSFLRALFYPTGSKQPIPVYFPDAAARQLPMYRRFRARLVAETHLPVDQYETQPTALKAAALGRIIAATKQ